MTALLQAERGESRYGTLGPTSCDAGLARDGTIACLCDERLADGLGEGKRLRDAGPFRGRIIKGTVQLRRSASLTGGSACGLTA